MRTIVFTLLLLPACIVDRDNPRCVFNCKTVEVVVIPPPASAPSAPTK